MSGGFFRGTSADQDTRFSNKQAKLLKSQKFAPELENLVDMTRVKMDVMRPWIAKRVTELIGFEDEVLINFIYTLLEGKAVNGKQIQISVTGFMERNTGKFMKELWTLLLSAQKNVSGVPQQFLDAKEEETKKKRAEQDHTINEIRMEEEIPEVEKTMMEGDGTFLRDRQADLECGINKDTDISRIRPKDENDQYKRHDQRRISRDLQSPDSSHHLRSPRRKHSMSPSKSSNSGSYSDERRKSRSLSRTPPSRSRSISLERRQRSLPRRSVTPRRKHSYGHSPTQWRRSNYSKRRSPSPSRYRAYSPRRHISRSSRYRSRSPVRRRSRTPICRSPMRYRSWTPLQRRSPSPRRRRSPSPRLCRSPSPKERSPNFGQRKINYPVYRSSISPVDHHSPSPVRQRSPSPHRRVRSLARRRYRHSSSPQEQSLSPVQHRSSVYYRKRFIPGRGISPTPKELNSPLHIRHNSFSPVKGSSPKSTRSPIKSVGGKARISGKYTPAHCGSPDKRAELPAGNHKGVVSSDSRPVVSLRSPQRDILEQDDSEKNEKDLQPSVRRSALLSDTGEGRRSVSPHSSSYQKRDQMGHPQSPRLQQRSSHKSHHESPRAIVDYETNLSNRNSGKNKYRSSDNLSPSSVHRKDDSVETHVFTNETKLIKFQLPNREMLFDKGGDKEHHESAMEKNKAPKNHKLPENSDQNGSMVLPPEEAGGLRDEDNEKRKHKKLDKLELKSEDDASYDSYEDRKEAKRRRKEEKKLKKGDRRRRREEKRRKRDERRAEKLKSKTDNVSSSSSDLGLGHSGDEVRRQEYRRTNVRETESDQRKFEIELREKALESLRAKKGFEK